MDLLLQRKRGISKRRIVPGTVKIISKYLGKDETIRVLDVGCGEGGYVINLCRALPNLEAVAVDMDKEVIDVARRNIKKAGLDDRIKVVLGDATTLSLDGKVDCVLLNLVLQDIRAINPGSDTSFLSSLYRNFPGAYFLISETIAQEKNDLRKREQFAIRSRSGFASFLASMYHITNKNAYHEKELFSIAKASGLSVTHKRRENPILQLLLRGDSHKREI